MTKDLNKNISSISYNFLNLPARVTISGVHHDYTYAADGRKLKVVQGSLNRDYVGGIIYENGSLKRILIDGGYIEGTTYYYYLNDHQGNIRVVASGSGTIHQRNHYYPFGMPFADTSNTDQDKQPYKYGGKEYERANGLKWFDFESRQMDPAFGRFTTMDPLAEKYYGVSPYVYCGNNPINRIDPDGRDWYTDDEGNRMWRRSQDREFVDKNDKKWRNIGEEYLLFNGKQLHFFQQEKNVDGELILKRYSYNAVSGKASEDGSFSYSAESQATKGGPIPEGEYAVWSQNIQRYDDLSTWDKFKSNYGGSAFPGGTDSWGDERTWIYPQSVSVINPKTGESVERTNMSIHGGVTPGSRGCIDLHTNAPEFFKILRQSTSRGVIYLDVRYPKSRKR